LLLRKDVFLEEVVYLLSISFILIAFARLSSRGLVNDLLKMMWKTKQIEKIVQEGYSISSFSSVLLVLNYLLVFSTLIYLILNQTHSTFFSLDNLLFFVIPLLLLLFPLFSMQLVGILTGESQLFKDLRIKIWVFAHFTGVILSLLLLIWTFNMQWGSILTYIFLGFILLMMMYRYFWGFILTFQKGISPYYIILYFCTLEILPLLATYVLSAEYFG
jgi:hypothetical protein